MHMSFVFSVYYYITVTSLNETIFYLKLQTSNSSNYYVIKTQVRLLIHHAA